MIPRPSVRRPTFPQNNFSENERRRCRREGGITLAENSRPHPPAGWPSAGNEPNRRGQGFLEVEYPPVMGADIFVAFTGVLPYLIEIFDVQVSPGVRDHSGPLQLARDFRDAGAANAHHLRQE